MKKSIVLTFIFLLAAGNSFAQSIICSSYKEIFRESSNDDWEEWPSNWTRFDEDGGPVPKITITDAGHTYRLKFYMDGSLVSDYEVAYDSERSETVRKSWDDPYVNCYIDDEDNYIYTVGVSLESLAQDSSAWRTDPDTRIYIWLYSDNRALVIK